MPRLLFEKTDNAVWISHLDLMRLFQRAFKRAGLPLTHTQGFNPRPSVSIALPLSVGVESRCELLDFDLNTEDVSNADICTRLNHALIDGITVLQVDNTGRKLRELTYMRCRISVYYDSGIPNGAGEKLKSLFSSDSLIVEKKTKSGLQDQDIIPMIRQLSVDAVSEKEMAIEAIVCCQNPTLNPMQLIAAIDRYQPELTPDGCKYSRIELFDSQENVFR